MGSISSELLMCGESVRSILLLPIVARCLETIDVRIWQGMRLAVAHSPVAIGNFGGRLECISMVAYRPIGNQIDNSMVVR